MEYPELTMEAIAESKELLGVPLRRKTIHTMAGRDLLLRYAKAVGCRNPLYTDLNHGLLYTPWASLVGHPTSIFAFDTTLVAPKLAGIHAIYAGVTIEWFRQIRAGEELHATAMLVDQQEKDGRFCGRMLLQIGDVKYHNGDGSLVAIATPRVLRTPRSAAKRNGKYAGLERHAYSTEEFERIMQAYQAEEVRGSQVRYFDDVAVGDRLPTIVKGPLTTEDMNFFIGQVSPTLFYQGLVHHMRKHPADIFWNEFGAPDSWDSSLLSDEPAIEFGFPGAHDSGLQRVAWLECLVTNWMGDLAFLRKLDVRLERPFLHADTAWLTGDVRETVVRGADAIAVIAAECTNQRGEVVATASAEVQLPARDFHISQPGLVL